jgi:hypothetical protein
MDKNQLSLSNFERRTEMAKNPRDITATEHVGHGVVIDRRARQTDRLYVDGDYVGEYAKYNDARDRAAKEVSKKNS